MVGGIWLLFVPIKSQPNRQQKNSSKTLPCLLWLLKPEMNVPLFYVPFLRLSLTIKISVLFTNIFTLLSKPGSWFIYWGMQKDSSLRFKYSFPENRKKFAQCSWIICTLKRYIFLVFYGSMNAVLCRVQHPASLATRMQQLQGALSLPAKSDYQNRLQEVELGWCSNSDHL